MIYNKRKLQIYTSGILTTLMVIMGFAWATHALSIYRATMERQIAEDNDIVKDNLSIIIHQVTQQNTDRNRIISQIQSILEVLKTKGWNGFACVLDKDGRVLAHPDPNMINMQVALQKYEPIDLLGTRPPSVTQLPQTPHNEPAIYKTSGDIIAVDWLPELKTYLCVHKSLLPVTEKINALRTHLAGTGFLIVAISSALSWFFLGMLVDRYESYLSRSEARNRTLVENSSPILITSPSGHLLDANSEALALFQTDRTKLLSKNIQDLWPEKNRPDLSFLFSITPESTMEYHNLDLQTDNGHIIPIDVRACRITYGEQEAIYLLIRDVTETRRAREEMLSANNRLKELDQLKTDFINTVSHELRTPLTSIRWSTDSLSSLITQDNATVQKLLKIIREDNMRLSNLIEELLCFSRIDAGKLKLTPQKIDFSQIAQQVYEEFYQAAQKKSLIVNFISDPNIMLHVDAEHVHRVVANLLDNAIKYTPKGGTVFMHVSEETQSVKIEITDSGIGISSEDLPHIFEKFYRSEKVEVQQERGTGLGLAIVKSIVEAQNGNISVTSKIGEGTTFIVQLPSVVHKQ